MLSDELVKVLGCPICKGGIEYTDEKIVCRKCRKYYPVKNNIPVLLIEEAQNCEKMGTVPNCR